MQLLIKLTRLFHYQKNFFLPVPVQIRPLNFGLDLEENSFLFIRPIFFLGSDITPLSYWYYKGRDTKQRSREPNITQIAHLPWKFSTRGIRAVRYRSI